MAAERTAADASGMTETRARYGCRGVLNLPGNAENQRRQPSSRLNSDLRAKVYRMTEDAEWEDQGTGYVTFDYMELSEGYGLFVFDENDNETLLIHRILPDEIYRKQEDTMICWRDPEYSTELALSFQETTGCTYIWERICNTRRDLLLSELNHKSVFCIPSDPFGKMLLFQS